MGLYRNLVRRVRVNSARRMGRIAEKVKSKAVQSKSKSVQKRMLRLSDLLYSVRGFKGAINRIEKRLYSISSHFPGVKVAAKACSVDVHYRAAPRISERALLKAVQARVQGNGNRVKRGRKAFIVFPRGIRDKAENAIQLAREWKGPIFFIGDDDLDAEAVARLQYHPNANCFLVKTPERVFTPKSVRQLKNVSAVYQLLKRLVKKAVV